MTPYMLSDHMQTILARVVRANDGFSLAMQEQLRRYALARIKEAKDNG